MKNLSLSWQPITDLDINWDKLASTELKSLQSIWAQESARLKESKDLQNFNNRLFREWSIETGIIENLYTIDRGTTRLLIEHGIQLDLLRSGESNK